MRGGRHKPIDTNWYQILNDFCQLWGQISEFLCINFIDCIHNIIMNMHKVIL